MSLNEDKSLHDQLVDLRQARAEAVQQVAFRDSLLRLTQNADWRQAIEKEFMIEDAVRAARLIGDPNLDAKSQNDMIGIAAAPGHLRRFISARVAMGNRAEENIHQIDQDISELQAEVAEEQTSNDGFAPVGEEN